MISGPRVDHRNRARQEQKAFCETNCALWAVTIITAHIPRSRSWHYWVTQRKGYAYFAPIINAAICVNPPNWVTDTPCAIYINRNTVTFAFVPFVITLRTTCGFYCRNRNRSLAVRAPVTTKKGQSRGRAASARLPALPSPARLLLPRWVEHRGFSLLQTSFFCCRGVRSALTDQYMLVLLPTNGLVATLSYYCTPWILLAYWSSHYYIIYTLFVLSRYSSQLQEWQTSLPVSWLRPLIHFT